MNHRTWTITFLLALSLAAIPADTSWAKGYSSGGGHSYSSHSGSSSHSSGFGGSRSSGFGGGSSRSSSSGSRSFSSGSGKSYSSGSSWSDSSRKSYSSSKSYTSGAGKTFSSAPRNDNSRSVSTRKQTDSSGFTFDTAAARARKEEGSREQFSQFKQAQAPPVPRADTSTPVPTRSSEPGRIFTHGYSTGPIYVPDSTTISTRPVRIYNFFYPYRTRPWVTYSDPYSSFFWWWLLDRALDDRAWWAYHHRYDMDPLRYQTLLASDAQLQARVAQLEAQQVARDPNYVPPGLDRDLMYSDQYVNRAYHNRSTTLGVISFWVIGVPLALGFCAFFVWLIWFKRWQTAT